MKKLTLLTTLVLSLIISSSSANADEQVHLKCQWTVYEHMMESFIINFSRQSVLWVEEEKTMEILESNEGYRKFSGIKTSMKGNGGPLVKNAKLNFKVNRVSERFDVVSDVVQTDRIGQYVLGHLF